MVVGNSGTLGSNRYYGDFLEMVEAAGINQQIETALENNRAKYMEPGLE